MRASVEAIPSGALGAFVNMLLILVTIWLANGADYLRKRLHENKNLRCAGILRLMSDIPDATIGVLVGMGAGLLLEKIWGVKTVFDDQVFFYAVLPPIIFYYGYSLKKRRFIKYFHLVFTLGVFGTFVNFGVLVVAFHFLNKLWLSLRLPVNSNLENAGLVRDDVLLLCSVLSSADEVAALALIKQEDYPKLSAVLFGEGVLNDAVSILLFRSILAGAVTAKAGVWAGLGLLGTALYLLFCSTLVGMAVSLAIARFLRVNTGLLQHPTRQTIIIMMGSYVSYAASELFEVPGVLSVFVCGIIFSHFAWHSLAPEAQIGTAIFSHALSSAAETYSFTALGLSVFRFRAVDWSLRYTVISILGIVLARAVVVFGTFGVSGLLAPRLFAMSRKDQCVLFGAGLIRGAITWAQALQIRGTNRRVMISTTLVVISTTLVVVGGLLPAVLRALNVVPNEIHDAGEMDAVQEALTVGQQEGAEAHRRAVSMLSPHEIAEMGVPGALSRQASAVRTAEAEAEAEEEEEQDEVTPLVAPGPLAASVSNASDPHQESSPVRPPVFQSLPLRRGSNGGLSSSQGPVLYGPVHRVWILLDEQYLKPIFGGRSRAATPWASHAGTYIGRTPHGSFSSELGESGSGGTNGQSHRHHHQPASYGAVGGTGAQPSAMATAAPNGNAGRGGALDPEALQQAFAKRGFRIKKTSFVKAAAGTGKGGGGAGGNGSKA